MYLKEESKWVDNIYRIERSDPLLGGEFGINNVQAKQLASRTQYLLWWFLSFHDASGKHCLKGSDLNVNSRIPEDRFSFGDTTENVHEDIGAVRQRYEYMRNALQEMLAGSSAPVQALYRAMVIAWGYGNSGLDFCLFTPEFTFVQDEGRYQVYKTVAGDDSIDVTMAEESLVDGEDYILSFIDNAAPPRLVTVGSTLEIDRVLLATEVDVTSVNALLSKSTWTIEDGQATTIANDMLLTREVTALSDYAYGLLDIVHDGGADAFSVQYRSIADGVAQEWKTADPFGEFDQNGNHVSRWRFEANGTVQFLITANSARTVYMMAVTPDPDAREPEFVRTPNILSSAGEPDNYPLLLERYGALYKDPFASLEIAIDTDSNIADGGTVLILTNDSVSVEGGASISRVNNIYVDAEVTEPVISVKNAVNAAYPLEDGTTYYWRARYNAQSGKSSIWTPIHQFTVPEEL